MLVVGTIDSSVVGFYLLDLHSECDYALLSYVAIDSKHRGKGAGTRLCCDAIKRFKTLSGFRWLFVEGEARQAMFYGRLGFLKLMLDYRVPCYGGLSSVPMSLMVLALTTTHNVITASELSNILRDIYINGYQLKAKDLRVKAQLARINGDVSLITWP